MERAETEGETRRRRRLTWAVAIAALLLVFQLGAPQGDAYLQTLWSDAWWTATSLAAAVSCFVTARAMTERHLRAAWLCFGLGSLSWFFGMLIWDFDELIRGLRVPFPSVGDALFDGVVPFFIAGAFCYKARQSSANLTLKQFGDIGIVASVIVVAAVEVLYARVVHADYDVVYVAVALAYPVLHLSALLFGLICLWQHVWGTRRFVLGLHLAAVALLAFVTTLYAEQLLAGRYRTGAWIDVVWVAAFAMILWASREELSVAQAEDQEARPDEVARFDMLVPALAVLLWVTVEVVFYDRVSPALVPVQAIAGAGLVLSLVLRSWAIHRLESELGARVRREEARSRELHARLVRAQKLEAVGTLAGGVAHDFNNLLHAAIATIALLRRKMSRGVDVAKDLDEVERALWRATDLTARLLSVAKKREPRPALVDARDAVAHVASLLGKVLPRGVELRVDARAVPLIEVDPAGLEHALLNLGLNARDAVVADGGRLIIELGTAENIDGIAGTAVTISVRDNGGGIAPEVLPRVFEPFFTTKDTGEGTGLGLAMVEAFVSENRGVISVESEVGRGSVFRISFAAKAAREATSEMLPSLTGTVMVVDLGDASGLAATGLLERCGFETIVVSTPEAAVEVAGHRHGHIEVVVADASSGMVGREAVKALRAAGVAAPIILIAGAGSDPSGDWAAVVRKPVDPRELAEAVRRVMANGTAATSARA